MKRFILLECLLGAFSAIGSHAQPFDLSWFAIDGGGGTSTGVVYSVSGTIGQPDAGAMSGGNFALQGGFWGVVAAIQTPGAPLLSVQRVGNAVRVFWPLPATGYVLDETTTLASPPATILWTALGLPHQTNATHVSITAPAPAGKKFYRLRKP